MNNNSDPLFKQYGNMDFTDALPASAVPALAKLQAASCARRKVPHQDAS
jgi:hypothetical protein